MVQNALTIGIPTFVVLVGILLNRSDYNRLAQQTREDHNRLAQQMREDYQRLSQDYQCLAQQVHADMMMIMSKLGDLDSRVARLEERHAD